MTTFTNFDNTGLNSNSNEVISFDVLDLFFDSQQRQAANSNRNNGSVTATPLVSAAMTSQASHNYYGNMLPTPEEPMIYNMLPTSVNIDDTYKDDNHFILESPSTVSFYIPVAPQTPQISPTLSPDASMSIASPRHHKRSKVQKVSSNNNSSQQQPKRKSINISSNNSPNGQFNANTDFMTGSPSNSIMLSLLELTSPLMNNMVATSIAPSLQDPMPNLTLGSNLVSDVTNTHTHSPSNISDSSSDKIDRITPSSLMKMKRKQPNSPKSDQNDSNSNSQQQQQKIQQNNNQDQSRLPSKDDNSTFIAPIPPHRTNVVVNTNTNSASPSLTPSRKSIRSNQSALSPLALGPKSPHTLKPTISPSLKPKLSGVIADEVAEQLANKSNYRSILDGSAQSLGISYSQDVHSSLESRRTTHKAAEQKRRDSLKQSFDELKKVVPHQPLSKNNNDGNNNNNSKNNNNGKSDGAMKNVSKLFLLKRAHDYIVELEQKSKEKDEMIRKLNEELDELREIKRQKIEETEKEENVEKEVDTEMELKDEQQTTSSNEC